MCLSYKKTYFIKKKVYLAFINKQTQGGGGKILRSKIGYTLRTIVEKQS